MLDTRGLAEALLLIVEIHLLLANSRWHTDVEMNENTPTNMTKINKYPFMLDINKMQRFSKANFLSSPCLSLWQQDFIIIFISSLVAALCLLYIMPVLFS